jgi:hypothetical protein
MSNGQAAPSGPSPIALFAGLAGLAGLGYIGYRYWYLPSQMKNDLARYAAQTGMQPKDALAALGAAGCQAFGAKYGLPPAASQGICSEVGAAAAQLARELPQIVGGTLQAVGGGVGAIGVGVGQGVAGIGTGVGQGVAGLASGVATGVTDIAKVPIQVVSYGIGQAYGGAKTVVTDTYNGAKTVISEVGNTLSNIGSGIADMFSF